MAYKLKVTELAERDLENIYDYISNRLANPTAASAFLDGVAECYAKLAEMPMMFERCRDAQLKERGYRRCVIKNYVMVYRVSVDEQCVFILRYFYGARDYEKLI